MSKIEFDPILVHEWLSRSARRFPNKEALICDQKRWTYRALDLHTDHLATALINLKIRRQDRVVILMDNSSETVISLYGVLKAGGVFIILSGSVKAPKLEYILDNSEATILITHTKKAKVVTEVINQAKRNIKTIWVGPQSNIPVQSGTSSYSWDDIFSNFSETVEAQQTNGELQRNIDMDLATLIYTSGSTGEPKGVMSTHHNMISAARSIIQYIENIEEDIILDVLPLSFDYGLYQVIMAFMFGGTVVLEKSFLYIHRILERIAKEKITGLPIVPTVAAMLLKMQDLKQYDLSTLRYITNTGAALPGEHIRRLQSLMPNVRIFSMFGLTECKRVCYLQPEELKTRSSSVGKAMPNCEVFIVDENGREVAPGQTGELIIRGSNLMQGYWNDPSLTAKTYRNGDYPNQRMLYSGDYFRKDDAGFLYFLGRKDDMIKSRGERISAKEVENILCGLNGINEATVIGLPDEILGQAVKVFIVKESLCELTEKDVIRYCAQNMETFMMPKYIEFIDELPKTPNGKIDTKQLKEKEVQLIRT